jgi:hypothetical protein
MSAPSCEENAGLTERIAGISHLRGLLGVLALCLVHLDAAAARPHGAHASSESSISDVPIELQSFPAAHLDIALIPCESHDCAIQVRLIEAGAVVDRITLPVTAHLLRPKTESVDESWGAEAGLTAYRTGFESDYVATTGRLITVSPGITGLLVTQRHNFEPMKHEHLLVVARRGKLRVAWKAEEGTSTWTGTQVIRGLAAGSQDIAYLTVTPEPNGTTDRFEATRLRWDPATAKLLPTPLPDDKVPLFVLSLGRFNSAAKAREIRINFSFCLNSYWVFDGNAFPPPHAPALVGKVFVRRASAETAAQQASTCLTDQKPVIVPWSGPAPVIPVPPPPPPAPKKKPLPAVPGPAALPRAPN